MWNLEDKKILLKKAFESLNHGGACLIFEYFLDDE